MMKSDFYYDTEDHYFTQLDLSCCFPCFDCSLENNQWCNILFYRYRFKGIQILTDYIAKLDLSIGCRFCKSLNYKSIFSL